MYVQKATIMMNWNCFQLSLAPVITLLLLLVHVPTCTSTNPSTAYSSPSSSSFDGSSYSLSYEGVLLQQLLLPQDAIKSVLHADSNSNNGSPIPAHEMVTDLATELSTGFIQIANDARSAGKTMPPKDDDKFEMDRHCYHSIMGGERCSIDLYRPNEIVIQFSIQLDRIDSTNNNNNSV